jgi:AraC-like DNA-binding protein
MAPTDAIAETIANQFGLAQAPTLLVPRKGRSPIAFTRLQNNGEFHGRTMTVPPDEAFSFQVALAPMAPGDLWISGRHSDLMASAGDTFVFDLAASTIARLPPPYDYFRFRITTATLDELACERGLRRVGGLRATRVGSRDPVMHGLALAVLPIFDQTASASMLFLDSVALAFHAHAMHVYGGVPSDLHPIRSGLAPWQLRRTYSFIEAHLDGDPSISDLAKECGLSASHFARAFRQSCGVSPHRWLLARRVERAKRLLLEGERGLAQIALACGFVDQSHLTRVFTRSEGHTPAKWRRLRCN